MTAVPQSKDDHEPDTNFLYSGAQPASRAKSGGDEQRQRPRRGWAPEAV